MKLARALQQTPDLRQRAAALRHNMARRAKPKPPAVMPSASGVAAAVDLDVLSVAELSALHDVAALIGEICAAISCQPRSLARAQDGSEEPTAAGRLANWQMDVCTALVDRVVDRLGEVGETARRDGLEQQLVDVVESLPARL